MPTFQGGLIRAEKAVDALLNLISSRLGLDHDRVLGSRYSFPLLARYFDDRGGTFGSGVDQGKILYWYIHTLLWGRYSGSTETVLNQDLALIKDCDDGLDRLIDQLRQQRGDLSVTPGDFLSGWGRGRPLLPPAVHAHASTGGARLGHREPTLSAHAGHDEHAPPAPHISEVKALQGRRRLLSPRSELARQPHVLTAETNHEVSNRDPAEYMPEYTAKQAGAVESHWIPTDPALWSMDRYRDFLDARRDLLAAAANRMLDQFLKGSVQSSAGIRTSSVGTRVNWPAGSRAKTRNASFQQFNAWVEGCGLPAGEYLHELADPESGELLAIIDLAWPDGLQPGLSSPCFTH